MFVDTDNNDFRLLSGSPCIASGRYGRDRGALQSITDITDDYIELPAVFALHKNYPNPFNASTTISYSLAEQSEVTLEIYDILGRKLHTLYNRKQAAGEHSVIWNADEAASGMYFYRLTTNDGVFTEKMTLIK